MCFLGRLSLSLSLSLSLYVSNVTASNVTVLWWRSVKIHFRFQVSLGFESPIIVSHSTYVFFFFFFFLPQRVLDVNVRCSFILIKRAVIIFMAVLMFLYSYHLFICFGIHYLFLLICIFICISVCTCG